VKNITYDRIIMIKPLPGAMTFIRETFSIKTLMNEAQLNEIEQIVTQQNDARESDTQMKDVRQNDVKLKCR